MTRRDDPTRHFKFPNTGITNEMDQKRRVCSYFVPIKITDLWDAKNAIRNFVGGTSR